MPGTGVGREGSAEGLQDGDGVEVANVPREKDAVAVVDWLGTAVGVELPLLSIAPEAAKESAIEVPWHTHSKNPNSNKLNCKAARPTERKQREGRGKGLPICRTRFVHLHTGKEARRRLPPPGAQNAPTVKQGQAVTTAAQAQGRRAEPCLRGSIEPGRRAPIPHVAATYRSRVM